MWFRYPDGWSNLTVDQQEFAVDYKDSEGHQYFVAPESLSAQILVIPGFAVVGRPEGAPDSIKDNTPAAVADPLAQLSSQVETMRTENEALKKGVHDLTVERDELKKELEAVQKTLEREHQASEASKPAPAPAPAAAAAASSAESPNPPATAGTHGSAHTTHGESHGTRK